MKREKKEKKQSKLFLVVYFIFSSFVIVFNSIMSLYVFFVLDFWENKKLFIKELMYQIFN